MMKWADKALLYYYALLAIVGLMVLGCHLPKEEWNPFYHSPPTPGWDPATATYTNRPPQQITTNDYGH